MNKVYVYGIGGIAPEIITRVEKESIILGLLDSNIQKKGDKINGYEILGSGDYIKDKQYDKIVISCLSINDVKRYLMTKGVPENKIVTEYTKTYVEAREFFVKDLAKMLNDQGIKDFAVAEGGVYKGEFSKIINESFPECPYYLFDTFEGFNDQDMKIDEEKKLSKANVCNRFTDTSVETVMSKLPHPEKAIICKGYFPETTTNLPEQQYGFVMLDFDLYKPILDGLRYFYPRMIPGGIILCHDYFGDTFTGVKQAIDDFKKENNENISLFPIGDHVSVAMQKTNK